MHTETVEEFIPDPNAELRWAAIDAIRSGKKEFWYYGYEEYVEDADDYYYDIMAYQFTYDNNFGAIKCEEFRAGAGYFPVRLLMRKAEHMEAYSLADAMELLNNGKLIWEHGPQYTTWGESDVTTYIV